MFVYKMSVSKWIVWVIIMSLLCSVCRIQEDVYVSIKNKYRTLYLNKLINFVRSLLHVALILLMKHLFTVPSQANFLRDRRNNFYYDKPTTLDSAVK